MNNTYFASDSAEECAKQVLSYKDDYYSYLTTSGLMNTWRRSYDKYHRGVLTGGLVQRAGDQGERLVINVNHYRNIIQHMVSLLLQQRPAFDPRATNSDYKSMSQAVLAKGLLDYYMRVKRLERHTRNASETCVLYGEGFIRAEWNAKGGKAYGKTETGAVIYEGDINYHNFIPADVIRDVNQTDPRFRVWVTVRSHRNRYDLMARYPDLAEQIRKESAITDIPDDEIMVRTDTNTDSDEVPVYEFYHARTDSCPNGRYMIFLSEKCILFDGPIPYKNIPVFRIASGDLHETIFGYSIAYDLLPLQEAIDNLYSSILSNQSAFGVQNIAVPKGDGLNPQWFQGMTLIEFDPTTGPPVPLNLTSTPPEVFNFVQMLVSQMETLSGVNSVIRGNPEASLKSGAALALVQSQGIQFSMGLSQSYVELLEDIGTATIQMLQDFATVPRVAEIVGKYNRYMIKEFTGADVSKISRVTVDIGNPVAATTAGKVQLADSLAERGLVTDPQQFIQVMETGRLDPAIEGPQSEMMNIRLENEDLQAGKDVEVVITDNHVQHIGSHKSVIANPEARRDPAVLEVTLRHLQKHMDNYISMQQNPVLMQATGQIAVGGSTPQPQGPGMDLLNPQSPLMQETEAINPPINPLTGEQAPLASSPTSVPGIVNQ